MKGVKLEDVHELLKQQHTSLTLIREIPASMIVDMEEKDKEIDDLRSAISVHTRTIAESWREIERLKDENCEMRKRIDYDLYSQDYVDNLKETIEKLSQTPIQDREVWVEVTQDERETCRDLTKWVYTTQNWIKPVKLSTLLPREQAEQSEPTPQPIEGQGAESEMYDALKYIIPCLKKQRPHLKKSQLKNKVMNIKTRIKQSIAEIIIETDNIRIVEDVAVLKNGSWVVDDDIIENLITAANDLSRGNGVADIDFVKNIYNAFLSDSEKADFIESITPDTTTDKNKSHE